MAQRHSKRRLTKRSKITCKCALTKQELWRVWLLRWRRFLQEQSPNLLKTRAISRIHRRCFPDARRHLGFNWQRVCKEERLRWRRHIPRASVRLLVIYTLKEPKRHRQETSIRNSRHAHFRPKPSRRSDNHSCRNTAHLNMSKQSRNGWLLESWNEVEKLLPTPEAKEKLKAFAEFLIKRNK